jgi:hypothetical protein
MLKYQAKLINRDLTSILDLYYDERAETRKKEMDPSDLSG